MHKKQTPMFKKRDPCILQICNITVSFLLQNFDSNITDEQDGVSLLITEQMLLTWRLVTVLFARAVIGTGSATSWFRNGESTNLE